jgi:hypothetical protein
MSEKGARKVDRDFSIHLSLKEASYTRRHPPEKESQVPEALDRSANGRSRIGARPIRWGWWTVGLAVSISLWVGLALLLGWL